MNKLLSYLKYKAADRKLTKLRDAKLASFEHRQWLKHHNAAKRGWDKRKASV